MKRSLLMALLALMFLPEAQASLEPKVCESEVYGWTSKGLQQITRQELSRSFCAETNAVIDQIVPCLEDAHEWFGDVASAGRRVELTFLTCSNVVQATEKTEYLLFDTNTATRASTCLQTSWDSNKGLTDDARYQKAAENCLEVLAVAPEDHVEHDQEAPAPSETEETVTPPEQDEDTFGPSN